MIYQQLSLRKSKLLIVLKYIIIILLSFCLTLTIPVIANAQISLFNSSNDSQSQFTPWWKLAKTRVCGRLWCSDISFPYFPYERIANKFNFDISFTIAAKSNLEDPQSTAKELEIRATLVEQTWLSLYKKIVRNSRKISEQNEQDKVSKLNLEPQDWLFFQEKPLHPLTPRVKVGIKDKNTVVFVPEQPQLGLSAETIVTVTQDDSIYNGKTINQLANQWSQIIQQELSEALWGYEFDRLYPWARLGIIGIFLLLIIFPIILMTIISSFIRNLDYQLKGKIRELREIIKQEQEASFFKKSDSDEAKELNLTQKQDTVIDIDQEKTEIQEEAKTNNLSTKLIGFKYPFIKKINPIFYKIQQFVLTKIQDLIPNLPTASLAYQSTIKQLRNVTVFLLQLLIWLRFLLLFIGLSLIVSVYPNTRLASFFFLIQAIFLPLIWMLVNLGNAIASFFIDYYLNRWAKEAQIADPHSNRYTLRVTTYSPALKGASNFVFIIVGIALTIQLLGIDPNILAGAGGAALLVGFLARNVLEDMLNGVLILWTDRYAIGDIIDVGGTGGFVENMNLYNTQIRGAGGSLITVPNGQISLVENKTKDWSRVEFKIEISANSDPIKAIQILKDIGQELQEDPDWQDLILEPVNILGVDQVSHQGILIQVWIKTQPMKQWAVGREYRLRIQQRFKSEGIELGIPQRQIWHKEESSFEDD